MVTFKIVSEEKAGNVTSKVVVLRADFRLLRELVGGNL